MFCLGRNGIFVSFVIFCLKFLSLCNRGLAKPKISAFPDRYTERRVEVERVVLNALARWMPFCRQVCFAPRIIPDAYQGFPQDKNQCFSPIDGAAARNYCSRFKCRTPESRSLPISGKVSKTSPGKSWKDGERK